jgi:hypothetical protein
MDSDGTISARKGDASRKGYKVQYSTSSVQLRDDIIWIVRSLGGVSNYSTDRRRGEKAINGRKMSANYDNYEVHINLPNNINPFSLSRKRVMYDDYVATVKREPIKIVRSIEFDHYWDGHCITVEAADHLYLTNDFIVTHNSALVAWIIEWGMATRVDTKGVVTANTENQLKTKTWAELAKWHRISVTEDWFTLTATALFSKDPMYEKTWRFDMIPWSEKNTEAFAGLHNKGKRVILIFDEASSIPDPIWEVSEGAMTDGNTELIWVAFGNPTKNTGRFKDCFGIYRHRWHTSKVDSRTASMTNKVKLQEWVDDYGEDSDFVRVRVRGEFPRAGNAQYISSEHVNNAVEREVDVAFGASKLMGVDVARFGEDRTVISRLHGRKLEEIHKFTGLDTMEVASKVAEFMNLYKPDAVFIDEIGIGAGVVDRLKQLGFDIIGVTSSNKADDERQYFNKRAEMWGRMKTWIAGADIPQDQDLIDDLIGPEYGYDSKMRIQLEKKSDMKKRGLASPDCFIGDTLITTSTGDVRIDKINIGDVVVTPFGNRKVLATFEIEYPVKKLATFSGLTGKPDHKIFTLNRGFIRLDSLIDSDHTEKNSIWRLLLWRTLSLCFTRGQSIGFKQQGITISQGNTWMERGRSIGGSGLKNMELSLMGSLFTMLMEIGKIITWKILKRLRLVNIIVITCSKGSKTLSLLKETRLSYLLRRKVLRLGIAVQKAWHGIVRMVRQHGTNELQHPVYAQCAVRNMNHSSHQEVDFVPTSANKKELIKNTKHYQQYACGAEKTFSRTSMPLQSIVQKSVAIGIDKVKLYNIEVEHDNVYYANGMLVENCADSISLCFAYDTPPMATYDHEDLMPEWADDF